MSEQGILQGLALGQAGGQNERLAFQFFVSLCFILLVSLPSFLPDWKVGKRVPLPKR